MKFSRVKPGMVFDNEQPPRFLYIYYKDDRFVKMHSINKNTPLDSEYSGKIHFMDWEDQFEELVRVDYKDPDRYQVFMELFG